MSNYTHVVANILKETDIFAFIKTLPSVPWLIEYEYEYSNIANRKIHLYFPFYTNINSNINANINANVESFFIEKNVSDAKIIP